MILIKLFMPFQFDLNKFLTWTWAAMKVWKLNVKTIVKYQDKMNKMFKCETFLHFYCPHLLWGASDNKWDPWLVHPQRCHRQGVRHTRGQGGNTLEHCSQDTGDTSHWSRPRSVGLSSDRSLDRGEDPGSRDLSDGITRHWGHHISPNILSYFQAV